MADSMAELVGSTIGRPEFAVVGFGDINRKTVEGVLGGWLTAFGINHLVIHVSGQNWPAAHLVVQCDCGDHNHGSGNTFAPRDRCAMTALVCWPQP